MTRSGMLALAVILGMLAGSDVEPATREVVNTDTAQTLSNKTLTSPVLQGNVGIGTTTPGAKLEVNGETKTTKLGVSTNVGGLYLFHVEGSSADDEVARIKNTHASGFGLGVRVNHAANNRYVFTAANSSSDILYVRADGNVGIGTTSPQGALDVNGKIYSNNWFCNSGGGNCLFLDTSNHLRPTYNAGLDLGDPNNRFSTLYINSTGYKPGGGSWTDYSDVRLKKNVKPLANALNRLLRLRGVTYEWKEPEKRGNLTGTQVGMVAHEVEHVFPNWVATDKTGYKTLTFRGFEALTVEALRELKKENDSLRLEIQELKVKLSSAEARTASRKEMSALKRSP
jgi:hypothetical protein